MSNTRHATEGAPFRQERFTSSPELQRGLMANLVVKRAEVLRDPAERQLVWALQLFSHEEGGLQKVAEDILRLWPERIGTPTMRKLGTRPGQRYNEEQVRMIRSEINVLRHGSAAPRWRWPLQGDSPKPQWDPVLDEKDYADDPLLASSERRRKEEHWQDLREWSRCPTSYPAEEFVKVCQEEIESLPDLIATICLDPKLEISTFEPFFLPDLIQTLRDYVQHWIAEKTKGVVMTEIGRIIAEECDYTVDQRIMSLINGPARIGKSFEAKIWCAQHPGSARYVQVPSSNDEAGFFRAIARAIGVSINLNSKVHHLRDRIEDVLQSGQLALVLDEAHFLWPTNNNSRANLPRRISWICTALVNHGVPVILITTPQFFISRGVTVEKAKFNCDQFDGRLMNYKELPSALSKEDLSAVARCLLPEGSDKTILGLVGYAKASTRYLAGIVAVVTRARYLAKRDGRTNVMASDVRRATLEGAMPSDKALAQAMKQANETTRPKRGAKMLASDLDAMAEPLQETGSDVADVLQPAFRAKNLTDRRSVSVNEKQPGSRETAPAFLDA